MKAKLLKRARKRAHAEFEIGRRNGKTYYAIGRHSLVGRKWMQIEEETYRHLFRETVIEEAEKIFGHRKWTKPQR